MGDICHNDFNDMLSDLCEFTKIFGDLKKNAKDIFENIKSKRLVTQKKVY